MSDVVIENPVEDVEIEVGSLTDVREAPRTVPAARDVKAQIVEVKNIGKEADKWLGLSINFSLVDGIEDEEGEISYQGARVRGMVCIYANADKYEVSSPKYADTIKKKRHLVDLRKFLEAVGEDIENVKINKEFIDSLTGKQIYISIGEKINKEGDTENSVFGYKAIPDEDLI